MCGIGGVIIKHGAVPDAAALDKMRIALGKRGPDGSGVYTDSGIGLVHTRLSIIDSEGGHQPIIDRKGRVIVFNGEIYNYVEIRAALEGTYPFQTHSDTETILALYDAYGLDFIRHLRGMYAFALYDPAHQRVVLARDPFGIKPFYMTETSSFLAFASEPKALLHAGYAANDLDMAKLRRIIGQNYTHGLQTPYTAIRKLAPGESVVIEQGREVQRNIRPAVSSAGPRPISESEALDRLDAVLTDTVHVHGRSDVGYGVFLSGGVDSSTLMQVLSRTERSSSHPVQAYTAYFDVAGSRDEREHAHAVATATGATCRDVPFGQDDFNTLLPQIAAYMDDPVADYAILPTWKLASVAATEQKVILSGEGGDELFAGYGRYRPRWWKARWWRDMWTFQNYADSGRFSPEWSCLQRAQAQDISEYLPNDLLVKLDTCLMAHGCEGRTPFLDPVVAEFAFTLPDALKLRGKTGKYLLKKWLDTRLPEAQPFRKKQGFTVPVGTWMADMGPDLAAALSRHAFVKEVLTRADIADLPARLSAPDTAARCWSLLYLTLWVSGKNTPLADRGAQKTILEALN